MRKRTGHLLVISSLTATFLLYTNCSGFSPGALVGSNSASSISNGSSGSGASGAGNTGPTVGTVPNRIPVEGDFKSIPSNFDVGPYLWANGAIPGTAGPDTVGAFRLMCSPSHEGYNDPIVYPGKPGASHLHQFFGNTLTDANSTYESLRTTGESTCGSKVNRSGYWIPAMMNGHGKVVRPDVITLYYKRFPKTSPDCTKYAGKCVAVPKGLRMIFGYNMTTGDASSAASYRCLGNAPGQPEDLGSYKTITAASKNCPADGYHSLGMTLDAPNCWDGVHLDSADHRSHMSNMILNGLTGVWACPTTHPALIPILHMAIGYTIDSDLQGGRKADGTWDGTMNGWHLSSDEMHMNEPGTTGHSDYMMAWDDTVLETWTDHCIDGLLNCSGGDMGNGTGIINAGRPYPNVYFPNIFGWTTPNRIVDPPVMTQQQKATNQAAMAVMEMGGRDMSH